MALPIGYGQTYTELTAYRATQRVRSLSLVTQSSVLLAELEAGLDAVVLADINDISGELSALDPMWFDFSVACFQAALYVSFCNAVAVAVVAPIRAAFNACLTTAAHEAQKVLPR